MACNTDVNLSFGKAINTIAPTQLTESGGGLVAGALSQYDILSTTIDLTPSQATTGIYTTKLVGFDFILDNGAANAVLPETLTIYLFSSEPKVVTTGVDLVPNSAFSTMDRTYFSSLIGKITLSAIPIEAGHTGILAGTANESQVSQYLKTANNSTTLYAVLVTESAAPSTIAAGATLDVRFKFEGVVS